MNEMFTKKPWAEPLLTLESGSSGITSSDEEMKNIASGGQKSNSPPCEKKLPTKRKYQKYVQLCNVILSSIFIIFIFIIGKRYNTLEKMIEQNAATRLRMHEEAMSRQDELLTILEKFIQQ